MLRQDARTDAAHSARSVFRNTSHYTWQHTCTHTHIFAQPFVYSPRACSELWHFFHTPLLSMPSTAPFLSCSFLYTFCELPPFFERVFFQSYFRLFIPFFFLFFFLYTIRIFFWRNCFLFLIFYYNKYIYLFQKILWFYIFSRIIIKMIKLEKTRALMKNNSYCTFLKSIKLLFLQIMKKIFKII